MAVKLADLKQTWASEQASAHIQQVKRAGPPLRYGHGYRPPVVVETPAVIKTPAAVKPKRNPPKASNPQVRSRSGIETVDATLLDGTAVKIHDLAKWQATNDGVLEASSCYKAWAALDSNPGLTLSELSAAIGLERQPTTWALQTLFRRGLVGRAGDRLFYRYYTVFTPRVLASRKGVGGRGKK